MGLGEGSAARVGVATSVAGDSVGTTGNRVGVTRGDWVGGVVGRAVRPASVALAVSMVAAAGTGTGVADATDTSSGSFVSFRIYEQVKCLTAPGDNALWFMYEPVLMSKKSFSRLNKKQQDVLMQAGKKSQEFFAGKAKGLDDEMVKVFKDHNVEVVTLTPQEYDLWLKVAEKSSYAEFAKEVPNGKKLIDEALGVK